MAYITITGYIITQAEREALCVDDYDRYIQGFPMTFGGIPYTTEYVYTREEFDKLNAVLMKNPCLKFIPEKERMRWLMMRQFNSSIVEFVDLDFETKLKLFDRYIIQTAIINLSSEDVHGITRMVEISRSIAFVIRGSSHRPAWVMDWVKQLLSLQRLLPSGYRLRTKKGSFTDVREAIYDARPIGFMTLFYNSKSIIKYTRLLLSYAEGFKQLRDILRQKLSDPTYFNFFIQIAAGTQNPLSQGELQLHKLLTKVCERMTARIDLYEGDDLESHSSQLRSLFELYDKMSVDLPQD